MGGGWTTADYALVISLCSIFLAVGSFAWSVWSKFIFPKPKVAVGIAYTYAIYEDGDEMPGAIQLSAVNHGPGEVLLTLAVGSMKRTSLRKQPNRAVLKSYNQWPQDQDSFTVGGFGLPRKLTVGEQFTLYLRPSPNGFRDVRRFGFSDSFGRYQWASNKSVKRLKMSLVDHP